MSYWTHYLTGISSLNPVSPPIARIAPPRIRGRESDARALRGDWERIGGDLRAAMDRMAESDAHRVPEATRIAN